MRLLVTNNDTVVLLMMFRGRRFPRPASEAAAAAAAAFRGHATFHPHFPCPTFDLSRKIRSSVANDHMCYAAATYIYNLSSISRLHNNKSIVDKMRMIATARP